MAIQKKLTDISETVTANEDVYIHIVDTNDISQSSDGSSYKIQKINFLSDYVKQSDINEHYRGTYVSESALNIAVPTGNLGDYAIVDTGSGDEAVQYIWDSDEGWTIGGNVSPSTTDALPEGVSNLYFTTARVLATLLTGISFATGGAIVSTDSILIAFGKIQKQITDIGNALYWTKAGNDITNNNTGYVNIQTDTIRFRDTSGVLRGEFDTNSKYFKTLDNAGGYALADGGSGFFGNAAGDKALLRSYAATGNLFEFKSIYTDNTATGNQNVIAHIPTINPTAGAANFRFIDYEAILNQTGSATGIIHAIRIAPTITSAMDFRAIEVVAGKVIIPAGSASNEAVNKGQMETAIDTAISSVYKTAGSWDASANTFPTTGTGSGGAVKRGDTYNVTVAGTPSGFTALDIGDNFYALIDSPGQTASNWDKFESNTDQATESIRGTGKVVTQAIIEDNTSTNDTDFVTAKKYWFGFAKGLTLTSFLNAVRGTLLTGFSTASSATVTASDSILDAFGKIQAQLNTKSTQIVKDAVPSSVVTGTTATTLLSSYLIPANTYGANDIINLQAFTVLCTGTADLKRQRVHINTSNTLSGAVQIALNNSANTTLRMKLSRTFALTGGNLYAQAFNTSATSDIANSNSAVDSTAFNPAVDNYILFSITNVNAADSSKQIEVLLTR